MDHIKKTTAVLCCLCLLLSMGTISLAAESKQTVYTLSQHTDKYKTQGRTAFSGGDLMIDWSASGIEFEAQCEGDVYVTFNATAMNSGGCYFTVFVDGVRQARDICTFNTTGEHVMKIASGLTAGKHTFGVYRQTEIRGGITVGIRDIRLTGELLAAPANKDVYVEFVGDSITTAYGNLTTIGNGAGEAVYQDATQGYAFLTAQSLEADYSLVAIEGIGASVGWQSYPMLDVYPKTRYVKDKTTAYDFARQPDVVVLALGTNDNNRYAALGKTWDDVKQGFADMLALVRDKNPNAQVVWIHNMMLGDVSSLIEEVVAEAGGTEAGLYTLQLTRNTQGGNGHPVVSAHETNAAVLAAFLEETVLPAASQKPTDPEDPEQPDQPDEPEELIVNGDFEEGAAGAFAWADLLIQDNVGFGGGKALVINDSGKGYYFKSFNITFKPNTRYALSFYAKGPAVRFTDNTSRQEKVTFISGGSSFSVTTVAYDGWAQYRLEFETGDTAPKVDANWGFYFIRDTAAAEASYIDNFSIVETAVTADRVIGGTFDAIGMLQWKSWMGKSGVAVTADPDNAQNNVLFLPSSTTSWGGMYFPNMGFEKSGRYTLSFKMKGSPIDVFLYSAGGIIDGEGWYTPAGSDTWKECTIDFVVGNTLNPNYMVNLTRHNAKTLNTAQGTYLDDFSIKYTGPYTSTALQLNQKNAYIEKGGVLHLTATALPDQSKHEPLVWASSNTSVVTVDQNGTVTAGDTMGSAEITVTAGTLTASCTVNVVVKSNSFALADEAVNLMTPAGTNPSKLLLVVTEPAGTYPGELTWSSSNKAAVTVDQNGLVKAVANGTAVITVKNADGSICDTCTVTVDRFGEGITGGDFENDVWNIPSWTANIIKDGAASVVPEPNNESNTVMKVPTKMVCKWMWPVNAERDALYEISFRVKGAAASGAQIRYELTNSHVEVGGGVYMVNLTDEWQEVKHVFAMSNANFNRHYAFGFRNEKNVEYYVDDVSLRQVGSAVATAAENGTLTLKNSEGNVSRFFRFGETVTVQTTANEGYLLKPGSLVYVDSAANTKAILNKTLTGDLAFGEGDGTQFCFVLPRSTVTVNAVFTNGGFAADTLGTSLHVSNGEYDGIRFLTRLTLKGFDKDGDILIVTQNGQTYEIAEFGTLLKRYEEGVDLTTENAVWRSVAYRSGGSMKLVDFTESYVDFTVVMMRGSTVSAETFNARRYTARGYLVLKDAEGNLQTVLCDTQITNSVNEAQAQLTA